MRALWMALALTACAETRYIYVPIEIPLSPEPTLPTVQAEELECLSDDVVRRIEERDDIRRKDQRELRAAIKGTHQR